eukprot:CAMPEP_0119267774 /NCGR_PEP_ID=MMETSP1329-20130426/5790_1 /TAXON_ID=114041 /ORGANISM="Genus nov. species nov., Strain RCC1024" /LENGTH=231 /DNA_ID=CAMNT_0007267711 /DNA_START=158 /DNA_END=849 /DNA_ORIENTATION=+
MVAMKHLALVAAASALVLKPSSPRRLQVRRPSAAEGQATPLGRELAEQLKNVNVYLIGMMGTGKSSVGEAVSRRLGSYTFLDTDATIESATGSTVAALFESEGEAGFRAVEESVLGQVAAYVRMVVATGGGVVVTKANWAALRQGIVVWLDAPVSLLAARLGASAESAKRPLLGDDLEASLAETFEARKELYAQADVRLPIGADEDVAAVADRVLSATLEFIKANPPKSAP